MSSATCLSRSSSGTVADTDVPIEARTKLETTADSEDLDIVGWCDGSQTSNSMLCPLIVLPMFACSGTPSFDSVDLCPTLDTARQHVGGDSVHRTVQLFAPKWRKASLPWSCNDVTAEILFDLRRFPAYVVDIVATTCDWIGLLVSITFWEDKKVSHFC